MLRQGKTRLLPVCPRCLEVGAHGTEDECLAALRKVLRELGVEIQDDGGPHAEAKC